jgi:succinate-acetate transporter protein
MLCRLDSISFLGHNVSRLSALMLLSADHMLINLSDDAAFSSYGAFWMSYATILIPSSGVLSAYTTSAELSNALGIYLITCACST